MPLEKHDLIHELPEFKDEIHALKMSNNHFAKMFENKNRDQCLKK